MLFWFTSSYEKYSNITSEFITYNKSKEIITVTLKSVKRLEKEDLQASGNGKASTSTTSTCNLIIKLNNKVPSQVGKMQWSLRTYPKQSPMYQVQINTTRKVVKRQKEKNLQAS